VIGGLPLTLIFIAILVKGFSFVGRTLRDRPDLSWESQFMVWALGCSLFAHAATSVSVAYFDQSFVLIYLTLGAISSLYSAMSHEVVSGGGLQGAAGRSARMTMNPAPLVEPFHRSVQPDARVIVLERPPEMARLRPLWEAHEAHPNNDLDYFLLIARTRPEVVAPLVVAVECDGEIVATLAGRIEETRQPFQFGYLRCGSVRVRKLSIVTGGAVGDFTPANARRLIESVRGCLAERRLDFAVLHNQPLGSALPAEAEISAPVHLRAHGGRDREHWRMSLPGSFDEFLGRRKKKHRYWLNRLPRVLEKDFPGKVEIRVFDRPESVEQFCRDADAVSALTYQRKLGAGFSNIAETREYCGLLAARRALRGYILYLEGRPCAYWLASTHQEVLFLHATGYDPQYRRYEVGTILFLHLMREACGTALKRVDFGLGSADYKERFGDEQWLEKDHYIFAPTFRGVVLNLTISGGQYAERAARCLLSQAGPVGRLKRWWRRRLAGGGAGPTAETP
jgi:CelD/BcsL family acetyltransferase involved in cellulose biosynthesis